MVLTTVAAQLLTDPSLPRDPAGRNYAIVSLVSFCVLIGGLTQLLLGFFRLGNLIKYIPHTVLSGFLNGIAILLAWKQLPLLLGLDPETNLAQVFSTPAAFNHASLLVGLAALGAVFVSRVFLKRLPSLVVGLCAGIATCGLLPLVSVDTASVATVGDLSVAAPTISVFHELFAQLPRVLTYDGIYDLCGYGVVLGMLSAMESLMSSSALESTSDTRADSNRELVGQGLGNLTAALFGAIASAGSIIRSHANLRAGGRGRLSGALCSAVMLLCVWAIAPMIGKIPLSIFAGLIISVGLTLFDWSILRFFRFYRPPFGLQQDVLIGFFVHIFVVVTVAVSVTSAVLVGIVLSTA